MVLQNYQSLIEMTSNIIDIVAFGVGFKCPRKIHLNTQCVGGGGTFVSFHFRTFVSFHFRIDFSICFIFMETFLFFSAYMSWVILTPGWKGKIQEVSKYEPFFSIF